MTDGKWQKQELVACSVCHAKELLEANGTFAPFALVEEVNGNLVPIDAGHGHDGRRAVEVCRELQEKIERRFSKGEIGGSAVTAMLRVPRSYGSAFRGAIVVTVRSPRELRYVLVPYRFTGSGIEYGEVVEVRLPARLRRRGLPGKRFRVGRSCTS
jgi:hypothetical protein